MSSTMYSTPSGSVTEQWERIARWLLTNLDSPSIAGADAAEIDSAQQATGVSWPAELTTLFEHLNGFPLAAHVALLPMHEMFSLDRAVEERAMELDIWGEFDEEMGAPDPDAAAGDTAGTYIPAFVPFAGADGYLLVVDARPGPLHGCVTEFEKVDTDSAGPRWVSISAMLTDLADSLETGAEFDMGWTPVVVDGRLEWRSRT